MKQELTAESVRHHFNYDPDSGVLTRRVTVNGMAKAGDVCATTDERGYKFTIFAGKRQYVHRLALLHVYGQLPSRKIEHRNWQRGDNRLSNLVLGGKLK
jgi:hypothetical protein